MNYLMRLDKWYPPIKYVFYPTYKFLRKKTGNIYLSYMATWTLSGGIHSIPLSNEDNRGVKFGMLFVGLGLLGTTFRYLKDNSRKKSLEIKILESSEK